jgi:hypothetical protein
MWLQPCEKYRWLQHPLHVVATSDVQLLQKKWQLQNQNVGDCLHPYSSVIASIGSQTAAYVCLEKEEKNNWVSVWLQLFGKRDCNQELCVLQMETWLCLCACYLVNWNVIANLGSKWLQKTKVSHCKICWFISVTTKKKKKTEPMCNCT